METRRHLSIVYLATEGDRKSAKGLEALLSAGYCVALVVAFASADGQKSALSTEFSRVLRRLRDIVFRRPPPAPTLGRLAAESKVPFILTDDKSLRSLVPAIKRLLPDVVLSNGWQFHISEEITSIPKYCAINCHSSYLPEYRGGNVTFAPLINGERETGVTVHEIVDKFDAGKILAQLRVALTAWESPFSINYKRANATGEVLLDALNVIQERSLFKNNPLSQPYYRCSYGTYLRMRTTNIIRRMLRMPIIRYEPGRRYE